MGELFRRYWLPALLAEELPEPDCAPVRLQLLSERLVAFREAGGESLRYIPCLNDRPEWIQALGDIAARHLQGWPTAPADEAERAASRERALALGAKD